MKLNELMTAPAVFAVGNDYQIMVMTKSDLVFWVTVGDKSYYDHSNGILRSSTRIHKVTIPMKALDAAKEYTVNYRKIIDRKPYFPELEEVESETYSFRPLDFSKPVNMYHIADAHGDGIYTTAAGSYFGDELDLLILNGDIPNHSGDIANFNLIYELCDRLTHGNVPCVFSRGNHDTRGFYAENIAEYTPTRNGCSYFSFRLGKLWGIVIDTGEDKPDTNAEYGGTICCHAFREEETAYIEGIVENADKEYNAEGVEYRFVISHTPFAYTDNPPFDIEQDTYKYWLKLLKEEIKPQVMICGHMHKLSVSHIGGEYDSKGQSCPVVIASKPVRPNKIMSAFTGGAFTLEDKNFLVRFTDHNKEVVYSENIILE